MAKLLTRLHKNMTGHQTGYILILVLILLAIGSLMLVPLLKYMSTGLNVSRLVYEPKTIQLYAADAGIEDAKWKIEYNHIPSDYPAFQFDPGCAYTYNISENMEDEIGENINGNPVHIEIRNVWVPPTFIIPVPEKNTAAAIVNNNKLAVSGSTTETNLLANDGCTLISRYKIKIVYTHDSESTADLRVDKIGVWLPPGFEYYSDYSHKSTFEDSNLPFEFQSTPTRVISAGNENAVWTFRSLPAFSDFPPPVLISDSPDTMEITFYFRPTGQPGAHPDAMAWIKTSGVEDIPFSWDANIKVFQIKSTAADTTIEAYIAKNELRELSSVLPGDYYVTGNTLMRDAIPDSSNIRDEWIRSDPSIPINSSINDVPEESSPGAGDGIPADAKVNKAYLYWTAWCNSEEDQKRVPTGDGDSRGAWNTSPCWESVDETSPEDSDYITGVDVLNNSGYQLFQFDPFSVPAGACISDLTIYVRAQDAGSGSSNNIRPMIKVNGTKYYTTAPSNNPGNTFNTYSYSYSTNPNTNSPWTPDDINGTGSHSLQQFGVYSSDLEPDIQISMVYAQVQYALADTSVYFKIDGQQVYYNDTDTDGDGRPEQFPRVDLTGTQEIIADNSSVIVSSSGFSYACRKDVTGLLQNFSRQFDGAGDSENDVVNHPGIARYTVGGVNATCLDDHQNDGNDYQLAHAGWALVIIYSSPSTQGHRLGLYDIANVGFTHAFDYDNVDFDRDGDPGGTIRGFVIPQQVDLDRDGIPDEMNAAKITTFVGEGDDWLNGDYFVFNGTTLEDGTGAEGGDAWNGLSTLFAQDGIDIDTFYVSWNSNLLQAGDTSARIDLYTAQDNWNLVFIILSFRSIATTSGILGYYIY